jgi:hypothetical protein
MMSFLALKDAYRLLAVVTLAGAALFAFAAQAGAATPTPAWGIDSYAYPSNFSAAENAGCDVTTNAIEAICDTYTITATNTGGAQTNGAITLEDVLPSEVTPRNVALLVAVPGHSETEDLAEKYCTLVPLRCKVPAIFFSELHHGVAPGGALKLWVSVTVNEAGPPGAITNEARVSGGTAAEASVNDQTDLEAAQPMFGFDGFTSPLLNVDGSPATQAGAHPQCAPYANQSQ